MPVSWRWPLLALAAGCGLAQRSARPDPIARPHAEPAIDFADALARVARRQAGDDSVVVAGARSILLSHGRPTPRVFVLLHGFTDSPTQFRVLGERFFAAGDNVYIPRLPHHADRVRRVRALGRVQARELASFGDSSVADARGLGDTIVVVGLSAGGTIAAYLAQTRLDVARVVLVAPALAAGRVSEDQSRGLAAAAARLPNITRSAAPDSTHPDYVQGIATRGLAQVLRLGGLVRDRAEATAPEAGRITFVLNERDHTVSDEASRDLARQWSRRGAAIAIYTFPESAMLPHNVMQVPERGGNLGLVLPVLEALALGRTPAETVRAVDVGCQGLDCLRAWWGRRRGHASPAGVPPSTPDTTPPRAPLP